MGKISMTQLHSSKKLYSIHNNITKYSLLDATNDIISDTKHRSIIIVPNLCNTLYKYGGVFGNRLTDKYPIVRESYNILGKTFIANNPGYVQFVEVLHKQNNYLIVANMIAQHKIIDQINHTRGIDYYSLVSSMSKIKNYILTLKEKYHDEYYDISIHSYKFGSTKDCNAKWPFIINLMEDIWLKHLNIYIYSK